MRKKYSIWLFVVLAISLSLFLSINSSTEESCSKDGLCNDTHNEKNGVSDMFTHSITHFSREELKSFLIPDGQYPLILWWDDHFYPHHHKKEVTCEQGKCLVSANRDKKNDALLRAIVLSGTHFEAAALPLPRKIYHEWALFHGESPKNNWMLSTDHVISLFNHTATFRRESDYPVSTQFLSLSDDLFSNEFFVSTQEKTRLQKESGLAPAVYVQRDCNPPSDRDTYVKELMKYIPIDSYGPCLNNKKLPEDIDGFHKLSTSSYYKFLAHYKFQLAFENAICQDYMTEKVFRPLIIGSVPVYLGSPNISDFMPSDNAVIKVNDFESPQKLAKYLLQLNADDSKYDEYLKHRKIGKITNQKLQEAIRRQKWTKITKFNKVNAGHHVLSDYSCHICNNLYERYNSIKKHLVDNKSPLIPPRMGKPNHMGCPPPQRIFPSSMMKILPQEYLYRMKEAKAIVSMIQANETDASKWHDYVQVEN